MVFVRLKPNLNQILPPLPSPATSLTGMIFTFFNSSSGSPCSLIERRKTVQGLVIRKFSHPGLPWAKLIEKVAGRQIGL